MKTIKLLGSIRRFYVSVLVDGDGLVVTKEGAALTITKER